MRMLHLAVLALFLLAGCNDHISPLAGPSLVAVGATWCRPCRRDKPLLAEVAREFPVTEIDIDSQHAIAAQYEVDVLPTYIIMSNGTEIERTHDLRLALNRLRFFSQPAQ